MKSVIFDTRRDRVSEFIIYGIACRKASINMASSHTKAELLLDITTLTTLSVAGSRVWYLLPAVTDASSVATFTTLLKTCHLRIAYRTLLC